MGKICLNCGKILLRKEKEKKYSFIKRKFCDRKCSAQKLKNKKTHLKTETRIYKIWAGIMQRCNNKNRKDYQYYGGRGIKCEWNSFEDFYKDMKKGYKNNLTIERKDNNLNYCIDNCSWKTRKEQANNRINTIFIKYEGIKYTINDLSNILNIKNDTLRRRYYRHYPNMEKIINR